MKKSLLLFVLFMFTVHLTTVSATTFSEYLPGGKNYLNPDNIVVSNDSMALSESIFVKSNQTYTLSFPDRDWLGEHIYVIVEGDVVYVDENPVETNCIADNGIIACTFTTTTVESELNIMIEADMIQMYYDYYGLEMFQLEEGNIATEWEQYVAPYIDSTSPEFSGSGAFITSYQSNLDVTEIISSHIIAYDEVDGDITNQIVIESDAYSGNETVIGEYLVELSVSDNAGNTTTFDLIILVKDEIGPVITCPEDIYLNVDDATTIQNVVDSNVSVYDEYDSNPSLSVLQDSYISNEVLVGIYQMTVQAVDSSGNSVEKDINIHVQDVTAPVLNSATTIDIDVSLTKSTSEILGSLDISDNYDQDVEIVVENNNYIGNEFFVGTYFIDIYLVDDYSNSTSITLTIIVSDNDSPVLDGPSAISTSYTEFLSIEFIKQMYTVTDNHDSLSYQDISVSVDEYSGNQDVPGMYVVELVVIDSSGNSTSTQLNVRVVDDVKPIIFIDQHLVVVEQGSTFGIGDMMRFLRLSNEITNDDYEVDVIQDEYSGNETTSGDYVYKVRLTDNKGMQTIKEFRITVPEKEKSIEFKVPIIYTSIGVTLIAGAVLYRRFK